MIDLLYSTGIRVGELVNLNIAGTDFEERKCVVFGKGEKEHRVYPDAKQQAEIVIVLEGIGRIIASR